MGESLRCKKCNTPLVIIENHHDNKIAFATLEELFCPKCGIAHVEVTKND